MTVRFPAETARLIASAWRRMVRARAWVAGQFAGLLLLIAAGLAWTWIPEKHAGQVLLTLLLPLAVGGAFLGLQAGTIRALLRPRGRTGDADQAPVSLLWGSATLIVWIVMGWVLWSLADRFDGHVDAWAGYLNSRFDPQSRSHLATYAHFSSWLAKASWILHWVVVPGLLLPLGCTALFGFRRLPWKGVLRVWANWRWWPVMLLLALAGAAWPGTFFDGLPHGTVQGQVWRVILKLSTAYVVAVLCWVLSLAWSTMLVEDAMGRNGEPEVAPVSGGPVEEGQTNTGLPGPELSRDAGGKA